MKSDRPGTPRHLGLSAPSLVTGSAADFPSKSVTGPPADFGCEIVADSCLSFSRAGKMVAGGNSCQMAVDQKGACFLSRLREEHDSNPSIPLIQRAEFIHAP